MMSDINLDKVRSAQRRVGESSAQSTSVLGAMEPAVRFSALKCASTTSLVACELQRVAQADSLSLSLRAASAVTPYLKPRDRATYGPSRRIHPARQLQ